MNNSFAIYIHIPFCKSKCSYCDFFSKPDCFGILDDYVNALVNQLIFFSKTIGQNRLKKITSVYIGGGTPSLLSVNQLKKIFDSIQENFSFSAKNFEATIELNPDDVCFELISFLENSFINRISLGIQSLKPNVLKSMSRRATRQTSIKALSCIKNNFTKRFSVDLIAGFPGESKKDLLENIKEIISYSPEHISLYSICIEEGTSLYEKIKSGKIRFNQNYSDEIWIAGKNELLKNGYLQCEISNFAISNNSCSFHNLTYWHLNNYLGFGSGATGSIFYPEHQSLRFTNTFDIKKYISFWNNFPNEKNNFEKEFSLEDYNCALNLFSEIPCEQEQLDARTEEFEFLMMNFRLAQGVNESEYETRFSKNLEERLGSKSGIFRQWINQGKAEIVLKNENNKQQKYYKLTDKGLLFLNNFLENI